METLRVGIVGLGRIASLLEDDTRREKPCTHAGAVMSNSECELVSGADMDPVRRQEFGNRWGVKALYASAEELLNAGKIDILHIATHPDSHREIAELAVRAGVKTIVCEKPLADRLADARALARLHRSGRAKILTNHERRYSADWLQAREVIRTGRLGQPLSVRAVLYMGRGRRLLDVLWHDGTHLLDIMRFMVPGRLVHGKRFGNLNSKEGTVWLRGDLVPPGSGGSLPFIFEIGAGRDHLVFEWELSCEKGRLRVGNGVWQVEESGECPYAEKFRSLHPTDERFEGPTGYFARMVADAVACTRETDRQPLSSAEDGLQVIEYLHKASGGWR